MNHYEGDELTCIPIDTYSELISYIKDPPPWRSLCKELTPHSALKINNSDIHKHTDIYLNVPETFCHINPEADDPPRTEAKKLPRTLVCHDMDNGYHDDSYIDGTNKRNSYTFYNWAGIDIFCYFSHHFVTIPPLGWINVAHAHGVKVIGTVITEWDEGVKFWEEVLQSESMFQNIASSLVAIAKMLKFDGWLLNIENKIGHPKLLLEFVQHLRYLLHQELPHAELIWYDSVTIDGHLNWQNGLNEKNKAFFNACDGLFTNYSWTAFDIATSAIEAGDRLTDLYIGIDVWGRNFFGGGKFNTAAAVRVAHEEGCSLAIFAPGWTHEAMTEDKTDPNYVAMAEELDCGERWLLRDRALWGSLWPYLTTRLPCMLPFKTSFCRGQGKKRRIYGEVISRTPWYNLRHQQYQPNSSHGPHGYVISTEDVILAVSTHHMYKDTKGILRVRDSFQADRIELFSSTRGDDQRKDESDTDESYDSDADQMLPGMARNSLERRSTDSTAEAGGSRKSIMKRKHPRKKRTCKECFLDLFKAKENENEQERSVSLSVGSHKERDTPLDSAITNTVSKPSPTPPVEKEAVGKEGTEAGCAGPSTNSMQSGGREVAEDSGVGMSTNMQWSGREAAESGGASPSTNMQLSGSDVVESGGAGLSTDNLHLRGSMVTVSVNLKLGQSACSAHPIALAAVPQERECLEVYQDDSFNGGSCLRVHPSDVLCHEHRYTRLLHCDFIVDHRLVLVLVTKQLPGCEEQYLTVHLHTVGRNSSKTRVVVVGREQLAGGAVGSELMVAPLAPSGDAFREVQRYLLLHQPGFYVPLENYFGWTIRYYVVERLGGSRVTSVNVRTGQPEGAILLGHLALTNMPPADAGSVPPRPHTPYTTNAASAGTDKRVVTRRI